MARASPGERGLGAIVISHNLDTVFDVADRIVVLRLGRLVATFVGEIVGAATSEALAA